MEEKKKEDDSVLDGGILALLKLFGPGCNYRQNWVQVAGPRTVEWSEYSVGMVGNIEGLCCCSSIFSTAFILALGCKPIHLQK